MALNSITGKVLPTVDNLDEELPTAGNSAELHTAQFLRCGGAFVATMVVECDPQ